MTTEPSQPYRGRNKVKVALRDANGHPIADADVSVVFFMAGMPAMGMPAMRVPAKAVAQGDGNYAADIKLDSGGTWQVTIVAQKGGVEIASKQLDVAVGGGM